MLSSSNGLVILVVDDDTVSNTRLAHLTQYYDVNLVFVSSAELAIEYFTDGLNPDAILLPWDNAHRDTTLCLIKSIKIRGYNTPVVLLTKYGKETEEYILCHSKGFELGAVAVLDKPYKDKEVIHQLKAVLKIAGSKIRAEGAYKPINMTLSQMLRGMN